MNPYQANKGMGPERRESTDTGPGQAESQPAKTGLGTQVADLSLRPPVGVTPDSTLKHAASVMRSENISSVVVETHPQSLVTERDLVTAMAEGRSPSDAVTVAATRAPVWVPPTLTVANAAAIMVRFGLRHLPVLDASGDVVGVLSIRQAVDVLLGAVDPGGWLSAFSSALGDIG